MKKNPIGIISMFYVRPFTREHFALLPRIKAAGCDFIELLVPEPGELDLAETRKALADNGLDVLLAARVNLSRDLSSADAAAYAAGVKYLETCAEIAGALGAPVVGGPLYGAPLVFAGRAPTPVPEDERRRRIDQIVTGLKQAGKAGQQTGMKFAIESLNRFETDIANTTGHALALAEAVDSPAVGIMLDTFHMNMEDFSIPDSIHRAAPHLIHFQANENNRTFVGAGHVDWPEVARALVAIGYDGPITLEPFRRDDERPGVPLAQWRAQQRSEDEELKASVAYLRAALDFAGSRN